MRCVLLLLLLLWMQSRPCRPHIPPAHVECFGLHLLSCCACQLGNPAALPEPGLACHCCHGSCTQCQAQAWACTAQLLHADRVPHIECHPNCSTGCLAPSTIEISRRPPAMRRGDSFYGYLPANAFLPTRRGRGIVLEQICFAPKSKDGIQRDACLYRPRGGAHTVSSYQ